MKTPEQIHDEINRAVRRLAQAYLYGTPGEQEQLKIRLRQLHAEERRLVRVGTALGVGE